VWIALAVLLGLAQVGSGALTGVVRDPAGAAVPGARVTITAAATGARRAAVSTADGVFAAPDLTPGDYIVEVEQSGFRRARREGVRVSTGETVRLDIVLAIAGLDEQVSVRAETPVLRAERAALGALVDHQRIVELPLNGRSFVTLAALAPGVALPPASSLPRINGGRPRTNEYLFDGISVLQPEPGQVAFFPVVDAIDEFKIESNSPPAEFGRFNGGVVNLTTKAGTNALHGDGFGFFRHEALNARNYFTPPDAPTPIYRRSQTGGVVGGPIVRDRSFFFVDYQAGRQTIGRTITSTVPTMLQRQGVFTEAVGGRVPVIYDPATTASNGTGGFTRSPFPGNTIPSDRVDPAARALVARYPLPTSAGTANNYTRVGDEQDDQDQFDLRIDHRLGSGGDQVFGRMSVVRDRLVPVTPLPDGSGATSSGALGPQDTDAAAFASRVQHVVGDRWLNQLRVGDTRRAVTRTAVALPTFLIAGYQQLGAPPNTVTDFATGVTEVADSLAWVTGRHAWKTGFDWRWVRLNVVQPPSPYGSYGFSSLFTDLPGVASTGSPFASFLLGQVQTFSIDLQPNQIRNRARIQEYFVQDDWKLSDRITLNLGTRYTLNFPSYEEHNQAAVFNLQTRQLDYLGVNGVSRSARRLHKTDFGPRLGLVARAGERTIVGAGYGMVWIEQAGITTPFTTPVFPFLQTVSERTLDNVTPAFALAGGPSVAPIPLTPDAGLGQGVFAVDAGLGSGYVQQWNASWQRELGANTALEVAYVASTITHVGIPDTNLNQLTADQLALGTPLLQRVTNPYFGVIPRSSSLGDPTISVAQLLKPYPEYTTVSLYRNNVGTTSYKGLEIGLRRRTSRGLSYSVSYTRSKLVDDASAVFDASILTGPVANYPVADSFDRARERDYSTGDLPHVFVSSLVWAIADAWTVSALLTLQSGAPIAVTQATNFNAFAGFGVQRPNGVGDPTLPAGDRTPERWFNTAAFAVAPQFTIGSASRNPVRGPSYRNLDLAFTRRVAVSHGVVLDLRAELFNALNTTAFGAPNAVLGAANFGTITAAGDPRVGQLAVKLVF
jgi:hypothetical protein